MTTPTATYRDLCRQAAVAFLQTALVIDNDARLFDEDVAPPQPPREAEKSAKPTARTASKTAMVVVETPSGEATEADPIGEGAREVDPHDLNAKALTDAFLENRIMCGIYKPDPDDNMVQMSISAAIRADIVIVDWQLRGRLNGSKSAKDIIRALLTDDVAQGGRLRLVVVYTGQPNLNLLAKELLEYLFEKESLKIFAIDVNDSSVLVAPHTRVVFCNKAVTKAAVVGDRKVDESQLPEVLIDEFAHLASGILPSTAMASISAIRESTHHLLAIFRKELDGAYVGHRCMIPHAEDAEAFLQRLISDELDTIVESAGSTMRYAGKAAVESWVEHLANDGIEFQIDAEHSMAIGDIIDVLNHDCEDQEKYDDSIASLMREKTGASKNSCKIIIGNFAKIFCSSENLQNILNEFSRLSNLKRESNSRFHFREGWTPVLTLGSILRPMLSEEGKWPNGVRRHELLFCVQPRCDSVRIDGITGRGFPFMRLSKSDRKFQFVAKVDDVDSGYSMTPHLYDAMVFKFRPSTRNEAVIRARNIDGAFFFFDAEGHKFEWIADVKDLPAQREVGVISARASSVGLDEHDWLRRKRP